MLRIECNVCNVQATVLLVVPYETLEEDVMVIAFSDLNLLNASKRWCHAGGHRKELLARRYTWTESHCQGTNATKT